MPIAFPTPTSVGQQFSSGGKTWQWSGFSWKSIANAEVFGATGATGPSLANIPPINSSSTYTLQKSDAGKIIIKTTWHDVYINAFNDLSAGDIISIYQKTPSSCRVISQFPISLHLAGYFYAQSNNISLAGGSLVSILCSGENEYVILGAGIYQ